MLELVQHCPGIAQQQLETGRWVAVRLESCCKTLVPDLLANFDIHKREWLARINLISQSHGACSSQETW